MQVGSLSEVKERAVADTTTLLWVCFIILNIIDAFSTYFNLVNHGIEVELNPLIFWTISTFGLYSVFVWKVVVVAVLWLSRRYWNTFNVMVVLNVVMLLVVSGNLFWL